MAVNNERIFDILNDIAQDMQPVGQARVVSCVVYKGKIVSVGLSQYKTHPFQNEYKKNEHAVYLHAEVDAINKAKKRLTQNELKKASIFVCRARSDVKGNWSYGIAKPCSGCNKCIEDHGLKNIYYTNNTTDMNISYTFHKKGH